MQNVVKLLSILLLASSMVCVVFISCKKDKDPKSEGVLNLTAINKNTSQVVCMALAPMEKKTFSIDCHVYASTILDTKNKIFGYLDCNNNYSLIDVETGTEIKRFSLPKTIITVVVDTIRNVIIGHYLVNKDDDPSWTNHTSHVLTVNLGNGNIVSDKQFYVGGTWNATIYFFRDFENEYVVMKDDELLFVNPSTGTVIKTLKLLENEITNGVYDRNNNRLIGLVNLYEINEKYIVTIDLNTGKTLHKVIAKGLDSYYANEMDYDAETNSYILVSDKNEVLFFDVETGKLNEKHQLDFELTSLKVWRSNK